MSLSLSHRVAFGLYEADLRTGELWKSGRKVRLQSQPFKVLAALLEHPGEVVTRSELQKLLWGNDVAGEFDHSLGIAVNKIRDALGDHADNPRFVETLTRRGYRFIAPVTVLPGTSLESTPGEFAAPIAEPEVQEEPAPAPPATPENPAGTPATASLAPLPVTVARPGTTVLSFAAIVVILLALLTAALLRTNPAAPALPRVERLTHIGRIAPGMPGMESLPASTTDGLRLFVPVLSGGRSVLSRIDAQTGIAEPIDLPHEIASPMLGDLSPDFTTLLLRDHLSPESEQPVWMVPVSGGGALRLPNVIAHDATWMPDGKSVLYATGNKLIISRVEDGSSTPFATLSGRALWLRWSPDGRVLRFTMLDPQRHTMQLWQSDSSGKHIEPVFKPGNNNELDSTCCGVWANSGKSFVFQARSEDHSDIWTLTGSQPTRLTAGPLDFAAPVATTRGSRIYFLGLDAQSQLQRLDSSSNHFVPEDGFLAATSRLEYSRDRQWVVWVDQQGRAWRAHYDGSERIQLTGESLQVFLARWSPNGQQIALMARVPRGAWQIYLVPAEGGDAHQLQTGAANAADPSWSPDGRRIVYGRLNDVMGGEGGQRSIEILDLKTGATTQIPNSSGLFSPRWSPDGRYIAALSLDQNQLLLFDTVTQHWRSLAKTSAADPEWARDSSAVYFHASLAENQPIYRVTIPDGKLQEVASLSSFSTAPTDYFFCGLSADGTPIVRSRTATGDLYSLDLAGRQ